jgi:hypothetical protein|nr:MAG TPA: hypothetical protein [Caudoviricetes sp.]
MSNSKVLYFLNGYKLKLPILSPFVHIKSVVLKDSDFKLELLS